MAQYEMRGGRMVPIIDPRVEAIREAVRAAQVERANEHNTRKHGN